ncbi:MAG: carbohydrate kinase family protein [Promethearchaeota archaeon]
MEKKFDVICIGAALVDMVAKVERHPLDDDEVFVFNLKLLSGGAAANSAYACAKLGLKTAFLGKLGENDEFGNKIIKDFKEVDLDISLIKYSKEHGTGSAYVALNKYGDRRIYAYSGAANLLSKEDIKITEIKLAKIIFLSSLRNLEPFIEATLIAKDNNIPVILNPGMLIIEQGFNNIKVLLEKINVFILSEREFKTLLNIQEDKLEKDLIVNKSNKLFDLGIKILVITMGKKGALLITKDKSELIPPIKVEKVIDTTGAGDAFSAGFILGFAQNLSYKFENLKRNVKIGNFIAGKCIQELGARNGIPNKEEIDINSF